MKEWLERHKVYFETLSAVALSAIAIVLGVQSNLIAKAQTDLTARQTLAAEAAAAPFIHVAARFHRNPQTGFIDDDVLEVSNAGAPVRAVQVDPIVFLTVHATRSPGRMALVDTASVLLNGYYFALRSRNEATGLLVEGTSPGNNRFLYDAERAMSVSSAPTNLRFERLEVRRYIVVKYQDPLGRRHEAFFAVDHLGNRVLEPQLGQQIVAASRDLLSRSLVADVGKLDPASIWTLTTRADSLRRGRQR